MSKTLETKKRILNLLKKKDMTISGISQELGLSTATISQHMDELQRAAAVEKIENEHFKKLKYYRAKQTTGPIVANYVKYVIGAIILLGLMAVPLYSYHGSGNAHITTAIQNTTSSANTSTVAPVIGGGALACPMLFYHLNGSIENYSGFSLYHLNSSNGPVADYVIGAGKIGSFYLKEQINDVLQEPQNFSYNRTHYAIFTKINQSIGNLSSGINYTISPQNFTLKNNSTIYTTLNVVTNSTAAQNTYWLRIDGPCGGGVTPVLVTVGNMPYNGTVTSATGVYA
jgi:DNA-binding transcriptional ArsR family regulator